MTKLQRFIAIVPPAAGVLFQVMDNVDRVRSANDYVGWFRQHLGGRVHVTESLGRAASGGSFDERRRDKQPECSFFKADTDTRFTANARDEIDEVVISLTESAGISTSPLAGATLDQVRGVIIEGSIAAEDSCAVEIGRIRLLLSRYPEPRAPGKSIAKP